MATSALILDALILKLQADEDLRDLCPDGVYEGQASPNKTRFALVVLVDNHDESIFGGRGFEDKLVSVTAVMKLGSGGDLAAAAQRIDDLLDPQPPNAPATLTIEGYGLMLLEREAEERPAIEVDEFDPSIRWERRGGQYRLMAST